MDSVEHFILDRPKEQQAILIRLNDLICNNPKVISKIRFKVPFFYLKSWFCYLNPQKDGAIELVFVRANELSNDNGLLDFRGRKQVAGIYIHSHKDIDDHEVAIMETLNEAYVLDENVAYKGPQNK